MLPCNFLVTLYKKSNERKQGQGLREVSTLKVVVQFLLDNLPGINVQLLLPFAKVIVVRDNETFDHNSDINFLFEKRGAAYYDVLQNLTEECGTVSA